MPEFFHEAGHVLLHALEHTLKDTLLLLPFLFLSYLLMEFLEHKAGGATEKWLRGSGKIGPLLGGLLGVLPQCGFSAAASGLYTGRIVTTGTLLAVYLSTSDEMLPILVTGLADGSSTIWQIAKLLGVKLLIGIAAGFCVDGITRLIRRRYPAKQTIQVEDLCEREQCHCEGKHFALSALKHTLYITVFLLAFTFAFEVLMQVVDISTWLMDRPILGSLLASLVGLIPNCASSVALTELYLEGVISVGSMLSGLLVNAGVGLAILFRNNRPVRDSFRVVLLLWGIALVCGIAIDLIPGSGAFFAA